MTSTATRAATMAIALLLAAVLLYVSLRGIDWQQVARIVTTASPARLALAAAIASATLFLRACRWRILLNAEASVAVSTVFWATAAGYFGNNFLPARAGELVRTFMIASHESLESAYVLATALSERVADVIALVVIGAVVLLRLPAEAGWLSGGVRLFAVAGLGGALLIAVLPLMGSAGRAAIELVPLPPRARAALIGILEHGLRGMRAFHDGRRASTFAALTIVIWSLDAVATMVGGAALGFRIPIAVAFLLLAGLGLGSALPSTPGYVGIYQFVAVAVLTPFGFTRTDAIAYILVAQALSYVVIGFWGSIGFARYRRTRTA